MPQNGYLSTVHACVPQVLNHIFQTELNSLIRVPYIGRSAACSAVDLPVVCSLLMHQQAQYFGVLGILCALLHLELFWWVLANNIKDQVNCTSLGLPYH